MKQENMKEKGDKISNVLLVPGKNMCDHPVCDAGTNVLGQSDVAFQLLNGQSLLGVLLVLLLQLQQKKTSTQFWTRLSRERVSQSNIF